MASSSIFSVISQNRKIPANLNYHMLSLASLNLTVILFSRYAKLCQSVTMSQCQIPPPSWWVDSGSRWMWVAASSRVSPKAQWEYTEEKQEVREGDDGNSHHSLCPRFPYNTQISPTKWLRATEDEAVWAVFFFKKYLPHVNLEFSQHSITLTCLPDD